MEIMICGSMTFSKEMIKAKNKLEEMGHDVRVPCDIDVHLDDEDFIDDLEKDFEHCVENEVMKKCFSKVEESDAILVLNYEKNNISGYIGTSTLMEMGLAYYFDKRIFLLFSPPQYSKHRWAHEVRVFQPEILNGDLEKLKGVV